MLVLAAFAVPASASSALAAPCHPGTYDDGTGPVGSGYNVEFVGGALESYLGTIDWGDGSPSTVAAASGTWSHFYSVVGTYQIQITGAGTVDTDGDPLTPPGPCDDDFSPTIEIQPELSIDDVEVVEGDEGTTELQFTATLSAPTDVQVSAPFQTVPGSAAASPPDADFNPVTGQLTFAPGDTSENVVVAVVGDRRIEPDETFSVEIPSAARAIISDGTGEATIVDDDTPAISITDASVTEGGPGSTTSATFTVSLSEPFDAPVGVSYATAPGTAGEGSDYGPASGRLTFAPQTTSRTVTVTVNGDAEVEPDETFFVVLSAPSAAHLADDRGVGTIANDDAPAIVFPPPGGAQPPPTGGSASTCTLANLRRRATAAAQALRGRAASPRRTRLSGLGRCFARGIPGVPDGWPLIYFVADSRRSVRFDADLVQPAPGLARGPAGTFRVRARRGFDVVVTPVLRRAANQFGFLGSDYRVVIARHRRLRIVGSRRVTVHYKQVQGNRRPARPLPRLLSLR